MTKTISNPGQFTSWHMERAGDNRYSGGDQTTQPAAGERSKTLVTDGRPAGTHFRSNPWFDGGSGQRGERAGDLAKYNGTSFERKSDNDAPFMKGDRARTADGTLRAVRADEQVGNNPTLTARAPEVVEKFGNISVGELRAKFGGLSVSQIGNLTKKQRAQVLTQNEAKPANANSQQATPAAAQQNNVLNSMVQILQQR
jgi:hypothetical protein